MRTRKSTSNPFGFSPDGQHLGYLVREQDRAYAVIDGKKSAAHGAIEARTFQWSPELGQFRYKTRGSTDAWYAGIGTQPAGGDPIAELVATPDGKHSAAGRVEGGRVIAAVRAGDAGWQPIGETYGSVDQLQISADGVHVAFLAGATQQSGKKGMFAVFDGHEGPGNFRIDRLLLKPRRPAHRIQRHRRRPKYHVVVDSLKGPAYEQFPLASRSATRGCNSGRMGRWCSWR